MTGTEETVDGDCPECGTPTGAVDGGGGEGQGDCPECGAGPTATAGEALAAGEVFDAWAEEGRDVGMEERHAVTALPVLDGMDLEGTRLLDLGTGTGWAVRIGLERGGTGVGVDASAEMLRRARTRSGEGAAFARADLEALPFPAGSFGAAFSMEAMYYAGDLAAALEEVVRVLEPGASFHALVDYYEENEASHGWPEKTGLEMHRLSEAEWAEAFREAGFVNARTERVVAPAGADVAAWKTELGSLHVWGRAPE